MENISKYIVTVNLTRNTEIKNNSEIIINNIKILIKISEDVNKEIHITKNNIHSIDYYDSNNELKIIYNNDKDIQTIYIKFDEQSQSAYTSFSNKMKEFNKIKGVLYYESGNYKMDGEFILDEESGRYSANGEAVVYYDTPDKNIYYKGEIENETFDGSGEFYNKMGNILLKVNNIDQNNPIGTGILFITDYNGNNYYKKDFKFDLVDDIDFTNFDLDTFVENNKDNLFNDIKDYDKYQKDYNIDIKIHDLITNKSGIKSEELIYRKLFELESQMKEMMNKLDQIYLNSEPTKRTGFFG